MTFKLITEANDFLPIDTIVEKVKHDDGYKQHYFIEGPFIQCEVKNRNGRNYSKELMERSVEKYKVERMSNLLRSFGELGHPEGIEINLDKVCHYVTSLDWQGNNCIGKAKILSNHPSGRILETFLEEKLTVGVSTRGLGALAEEPNQDGSKQVEAYEMIAIDAVADPSAPQGFVDGILENKKYIVQDNGVILECYDNLEKQVRILPTKLDDRAKLFTNLLENFLKNI